MAADQAHWSRIATLCATVAAAGGVGMSPDRFNPHTAKAKNET